MSRSRTPSRLGVVVFIVIGILVLAIFYPALRWLVSEWLGNDFYSHGFLVPPLSAVIAWRLWTRWPAEKRRLRSAPAGLALFLLGLAAYSYVLFLRAYFAAALAMISVIAGLVWYLLGTAALHRLAFPILFLLFMVPLPLVEPLSVPLAQFTGAVAAGVVRIFGVPIIVNGPQVTLPNANLVVGAQCSGLRSIVTLLTLVGLAVFLLEGPWPSKLVLALSSIPIAIIGNVLRVASLLGVANLWGAEAGFTYYHDYSSIVFFLSALVLLLIFSRGVGCREIRSDIF